MGTAGGRFYPVRQWGFMSAVGGVMLLFAERKRPTRGSDDPLLRTYRVDYQAGAETGSITWCTGTRPTALLVTEAHALLRSRGLEGTMRRIVPVSADHRRA